MNTLPLFFLVSLASTAAPGPAVFYVTSQSVLGGLRLGVPAALGILSADALYIVLSVTGLSAVLAASYQLFSLMKWAGVAYLLYLGVRLLLSAFSPEARPESASAPAASGRKCLVGGFAVHAANPKALLYFGSLVPQFVNPTRPLAPQLAVLAAVHLATAAVVMISYAGLAAQFRRSSVNARTAKVFRVAAGSSLLAAAASLALIRKSAQ